MKLITKNIFEFNYLELLNILGIQGFTCPSEVYLVESFN